MDGRGGTSQLDRLLETVVAGGFCIGCGACAALPQSALRMEMDAFGRLQARLTDTGDPDQAYLEVCPFSERAEDETTLARERFPDAPWDDRIGAYRRLYVGHVAEGEFRAHGAAGGMGAWILSELLVRGMVDSVVHVQSTPGEDRLFRYRISTSPEEVWGGSRSAYYPIEMSEMLKVIRERPGRYAIVGIPCFIKAVRLSTRRDPELTRRVPYCLGLFSGHLKSSAFAELLGWQAGIEPGRLQAIDFRTKLPDRPANRYGMTAYGPEGPVTRPMAQLQGGDWGMGYFKYKACDYCDDVGAEVADIAIGDAWLPGHAHDPRGTNVVVVRAPALVPLIEDAVADGRLALDPLSVEDVVLSQAAAFRHRRDLLPDRLAASDERGEWRPPKRLAAAPGTPAERAKNEARERLREESQAAFAEARASGDLEVVAARMKDAVEGYQAVREPGRKLQRQVQPPAGRLRGPVKRLRRAISGSRARDGGTDRPGGADGKDPAAPDSGAS